MASVRSLKEMARALMVMTVVTNLIERTTESRHRKKLRRSSTVYLHLRKYPRVELSSSCQTRQNKRVLKLGKLKGTHR